MPVYCFKCPKCKSKKEAFREMSQSDKSMVCDCKAKMNRDHFAEKGPQRYGDNWPMVSYAAGVSPDEVPAMMEVDRKHGVETNYTSDGDPIFTSPKHRKKYCEAHGLYDRNAGLSDPLPARAR